MTEQKISFIEILEVGPTPSAPYKKQAPPATWTRSQSLAPQFQKDLMFTAPRSVLFLGAPIADLHRSNRGTSPRITAVYTSSSERPSSPSQSRATSLYDTLGVSLTATSQEIKAAYRRLARTCHPDVGASADGFMRIHRAYSTLSDPGKRADYDRAVLGSARQQRVQAPGQVRPVSPFTGGFCRRRTWETDQCW